MTPALPSRSSDRVQRSAIGVAAAASKFAPILMGTAMAVYIGRRGGSPLAVSLVLALYFFGLMTFAPVWGALADVTGRRRDVLLAVSALGAIAALPLVVVDGIWLPLTARTVYAAFAAGYLPVMLAVVSERGGAEARGRSVGFFSSAQAVGFTFGQLFAGVLLGLLAAPELFGVVAAASGVVLLAALVVEDPNPDRHRRVAPGELAGEVKRRLFPSAAGREHLYTNGLMWLYAATLLRNMTVLGTTSLLPVYIVTDLGLSEFLMGALLAVNPAGQIATMYLVGEYADRLGRKPFITLGMAGSGAFAAAMAAAALVPSAIGRAVVVAVGMALLAVAFSGTRVGAVSFIGDVAPENRESELIGFRSTARGFGGMVGPALFGLASTVTSIELTYAVGSLLAFAAAVLTQVALVESFETPDAPVGAEPESDAD
ncbi:MFS transporter [Halobium salinum]|uniref:MFS transporter n=1 Tax=Halobium salinum TaxID=1364940 RepID=A0ABD5PI61_9EURY|nr:MFS transporter [Halobium salinum]